MPLTSRRMRRTAALLTVTALGGALLAGCSADGRETLRFTFSKREALPFMQDVVQQYNASQDDVTVELDSSGVDVVSASFVRGNPPDIMLANYNYEVARFVQRCALTDLSDTAASSEVRDDLQPLMEQYGSCEGRTSALPYSVMASSVIYNTQIFEENGLDIPTTWDELLAVCDALEAAGITPFYGTFKDDWTVAQGWYDYAIGGSVDVIDFFDGLAAEGADVDSSSDVSFAKDFTPPVEKMLQLAQEYTNDDADSRAYGDGNLDFGNGEAAMYLQGPWAFSEIEKTAPAAPLGTFPLPMTDDPDDRKVRVNMDLAVMIPEASAKQDAARDFLEYLYQPEIIEDYNASQLGFSPTTDAAAPDDPRIAGMQEFYDSGAIYQGPSVLVPKTIPVFAYAQAMMFGQDPERTFATMDDDWSRLAFRQPVLTDEAGEATR
jgi:raffinose/stachyose/melibiose transport system substrate-binding protein